MLNMIQNIKIYYKPLVVESHYVMNYKILLNFDSVTDYLNF